MLFLCFAHCKNGTVYMSTQIIAPPKFFYMHTCQIAGLYANFAFILLVRFWLVHWLFSLRRSSMWSGASWFLCAFLQGLVTLGLLSRGCCWLLNSPCCAFCIVHPSRSHGLLHPSGIADLHDMLCGFSTVVLIVCKGRLGLALCTFISARNRSPLACFSR